MEGNLPASVFSQLFPKGRFIKTATAETKMDRSPCFPQLFATARPITHTGRAWGVYDLWPYGVYRKRL